MFTNPSDANHFLRSLFWTLVYENKIIHIKQYFFIFRILMIKKEKEINKKKTTINIKITSCMLTCFLDEHMIFIDFQDFVHKYKTLLDWCEIYNTCKQELTNTLY